MHVSKFLKHIFTFGQILAFTPSFPTPKVTLLQQIYAVIVLTFITIVLAVSISNKKFYSNHNHLKGAASALLDLNLIVFNYCSVLVVFTKRQHWKKLMNDLRVIAGKIGEAKKTPFIFAATLIIGAGVISVSLFIWIGIYQMWYFGRYGIKSLQVFLLFSYNAFLCLIITLILSLYRRIKNSVGNFHHTNMHTIEKLEHFLCFLKDTIDTFNEIFAWPIMLLISYTNLLILNDSFAIFMKSNFYESGENRSKELAADISVMTLVFVSTTVLIIYCDLVEVEVEKILLISHRLRRAYRNSSGGVKEELYEFTNTIIENFPSFTAARFFKVQRSVIISMLGTLTTFLLIMIQFRISIEKEFE